ncbi:MAG: hypothetical protein PHY56_01005 [Candidatus Omnitrophica bacterium]|jgi:hypothetical protein|nr:hypothetical protein [Candidatus Omnitrophota bacterium]
MSKHLKIIFQEMCKRVGVKYKSVDFYKSEWYYEQEWTIEQEEDFMAWLEKYLLASKEARTELMAFSDKHNVKRFVLGFVCNYGWKFKK